MDNAGKIRYFHTNHLGSSHVVTDENGALKGLFEYKPYGEFSREENYETGEQAANFYFTNQYRDKETGLYYYGARYYDPQIGRFISADTIVQAPDINPQTFNRYSYTGNNPVNNIDPTGHSFWKKIGNFFKKAAGAIVGVAFTFVGMPFIGAIVSSALSTGINGGSFADFGIGLGVGFAAGIVGGYGAGKIGSFFGMDKAGLGLASLRGGLSGAVGGAGGAAIYKQNIWKGALIGAGGGVATAGGLWKLNDIRTNNFLDKVTFQDDPANNQIWSADEQAKIIQGIRESGQSPVGGRLMSKFLARENNLLINKINAANGSAIVGGNEMWLNPDVSALNNSNSPAYTQLSSLDMGGYFTHEFGHINGNWDRIGMHYPNVSYNSMASENPYRLWNGMPLRTGYYGPGDVKFRPWHKIY